MSCENSDEHGPCDSNGPSLDSLLSTLGNQLLLQQADSGLESFKARSKDDGVRCLDVHVGGSPDRTASVEVVRTRHALAAGRFCRGVPCKSGTPIEYRVLVLVVALHPACRLSGGFAPACHVFCKATTGKASCRLRRQAQEEDRCRESRCERGARVCRVRGSWGGCRQGIARHRACRVERKLADQRAKGKGHGSSGEGGLGGFIGAPAALNSGVLWAECGGS